MVQWDENICSGTPLAHACRLLAGNCRGACGRRARPPGLQEYGLVARDGRERMAGSRLNWGAVTESLELVRDLKAAGVCMCDTLDTPCWLCRLEAAEASLVGLLKESGSSTRVYEAWVRAMGLAG